MDDFYGAFGGSLGGSLGNVVGGYDPNDPVDRAALVQQIQQGQPQQPTPPQAPQPPPQPASMTPAIAPVVAPQIPMTQARPAGAPPAASPGGGGQMPQQMQPQQVGMQRQPGGGGGGGRGPANISSGLPIGPSSDFAAALGTAPSSHDTLNSVIAGLGKGLTAGGAGSNTGMGKFMQGAGGALTGANNDAMQAQKLRDAQQNQAFNQVSKAFSDWQTSKRTDAMDNWYNTRSDVNNSKAQNAPKSAWQLSPVALMHTADGEVQGQYNKDSDRLLKVLQAGGMTQEQYQTKQQALDDSLDQKRRDRYTQYGLDPDTVAKGKAMGGTMPQPAKNLKVGDYYIDPTTGKPAQYNANTKLDPDQKVKQIVPFDGDKMNMDDFHSNVPMGGWYTNQGHIYTRSTPPQPSGGGQQQPQQQLQQAAPAPQQAPPQGPQSPYELQQAEGQIQALQQ